MTVYSTRFWPETFTVGYQQNNITVAVLFFLGFLSCISSVYYHLFSNTMVWLESRSSSHCGRYMWHVWRLYADSPLHRGQGSWGITCTQQACTREQLRSSSLWLRSHRVDLSCSSYGRVPVEWRRAIYDCWHISSYQLVGWESAVWCSM